MKINIRNAINWEPLTHVENLTEWVHAVSQKEKPARLAWHTLGGFVVENKLAGNS